MLKSRTTTEVFEYDGTAHVSKLETHLPSAYVTFDYNGATYRIQEIQCRTDNGQRYRHQVKIIQYDPHTNTYGDADTVDTIGVSIGDLAHICGPAVRDAFPGLQ